jgi:hypothetical protein
MGLSIPRILGMLLVTGIIVTIIWRVKMLRDLVFPAIS